MDGTEDGVVLVGAGVVLGAALVGTGRGVAVVLTGVGWAVMKLGNDVVRGALAVVLLWEVKRQVTGDALRGVAALTELVPTPAARAQTKHKTVSRNE